MVSFMSEQETSEKLLVSFKSILQKYRLSSFMLPEVCMAKLNKMDFKCCKLFCSFWWCWHKMFLSVYKTFVFYWRTSLKIFFYLETIILKLFGFHNTKHILSNIFIITSREFLSWCHLLLLLQTMTHIA